MKLSKTLAALALATLGAAAYAGDQYVEIGLGSVSASAHGVSASASAASFTFGSKFTDNISGEVFGAQSGDITASGYGYSVTVPASVSAVGAGVKLSAEFAKDFQGFVRAGFSHNTATARAGGYSVSTSATDPYVGAGISYDINKDVYVGAEFRRYMSTYDVDHMGVTLGFRF